MARLHGGVHGFLHSPGAVDKDGAVVTGKTNLPYLPRDPERRRNLLKVLGITEDQLLTMEDMR